MSPRLSPSLSLSFPHTEEEEKNGGDGCGGRVERGAEQPSYLPSVSSFLPQPWSLYIGRRGTLYVGGQNSMEGDDQGLKSLEQLLLCLEIHQGGGVCRESSHIHIQHPRGKKWWHLLLSGCQNRTFADAYPDAYPKTTV